MSKPLGLPGPALQQSQCSLSLNRLQTTALSLPVQIACVPTLVHAAGTCPTPAMSALCRPSFFSTHHRSIMDHAWHAIHFLHSTPRFPVLHCLGGITNGTQHGSSCSILHNASLPTITNGSVFYQYYRSCLAACPHYTPRFLVHLLAVLA
jgi:hypothetical protein